MLHLMGSLLVVGSPMTIQRRSTDKWWIAWGIAMSVVLAEALFSIFTQLTLDRAQNLEDSRYNRVVDAVKDSVTRLDVRVEHLEEIHECGNDRTTTIRKHNGNED